MPQHHPHSSAGPPRGRLNGRYIALLLGAAVLILVVGALLRPEAESAAAAAAPTNELATLPERSQRRELRDIADYVGQRAASLAASVVYLPAVGASGVMVGRDSVLSAAPSPRAPEILVVHGIGGDSVRPASRAAGGDTVSPRWALAVARAPDGRPLWLAGLTGSAAPVPCGGLALRELIFGPQTPEAFAGGGLFDLDGNMLALAIPCTGRIAFVPLGEVAAALERQAAPEFRLWARFGFRVAPADALRPAMSGAESGVAVVETRVGGQADLAGLRPGDVIGSTGSGPVTASSDLAPLTAASETGRLVVRRGRGSVALMVVADSGERRSPGLIADGPGEGLVLRAVGADSRAERAGLRAGDRILQVGRDRRPAPAAIDRAFRDGGAVFVVYEREGRRRGIVLP